MIAALHRMGFETGFWGVTGETDAASLRLEELGKPENLNIFNSSLPAGRCLALLEETDKGKDRTLVILPNANDRAGTRVIDCAFFRQARWVHMTSFVSSTVLVAQAAVAESLPTLTRLSFDPGAVYCKHGMETLMPVLKHTQVLFLTGRELAMLTSSSVIEAGVERLFKIGLKTVVVKLGADGMMAFQGESLIRQPAVVPDVVRDRTGAGDVAAAGFLAGELRSLELEQCLELAVICASRSIEGYGRSRYPDQDLLEKYLSTRSSRSSSAAERQRR